jgi:ABC-type transport system involved in multi-copper enzyme maturation permease subunit
MSKSRLADWLPWRWRVFGPILPYDLLTSCRRGRWYLLRIVLTGLMFFVFWQASERYDTSLQWRGSREGAKADFAQGFYNSFATIHITAALLLATAFLGGAIADERRRRILEFMFATDLTSREIILGKFTSRMIMIGALLAGSLPILACTMLFGGVSVDWIVQLAVATVTTLICFGGLSVLVSTTIARPRDAVVRAMALTALLVGVPPIISVIAMINRNPFWNAVAAAVEYPGLLNPYSVLYHQMTAPAGAPELAWGRTFDVAVAQTIVGFLALFVAILTVRRTIVNPPSESPTKKTKSPRRRFWRPELGDWSPILWREAFGEPAMKSRGRFGRVIGVLIFVLLNFSILSTWLYTSSESFFGAPTILYSMGPIACLVAILYLVMVGTRAAGSVTSEREADTWTTLIAGPIESDAVVSGKVNGAILNFRHLLVPFFLVWFLVGLSLPLEAMFRAGAMLLVALLFAFVNANIGFYFSMRSKSTTAAVVKTVITILFLGGGYMFPAALLFNGGSEAILTFAQFFHVSFPAFAQFSESRGGDMDQILPYFCCGCILYAIFGTGLYGYNRAIFDLKSGRSTIMRPPASPPAKPRTVPNSGEPVSNH